jgi:hypothetical protein
MTNWHIVYLSFESKQTGRDYIGKHTTKNLHDGYLGSYYDSLFSPDSRIILGYYKTAKAAVIAEIQWQKVFQVATDPQFANQVYQTSSKFDAGHLRWYYDPETNQEVYLESCPEGYLLGRPSMKDPEKVEARLKNRVCASGPKNGMYGKSNSGEKNGRCKIKKNQVPQILTMKQSKQFTVQEIATMFGVSPVTIRRVTNNPNYWCNR